MAATWISLAVLVSRLSAGGGSVVPIPVIAQEARKSYDARPVIANAFTASVHQLSSAGKDYAVIDAPRYEVMVRPGRIPLYLTVPVALSWGVKGGFMSELSIGFGISWSPVRYVSVYGQQRLGTFFFNHGAIQRSAGLTINIPIEHRTFADGTRRERVYLVVGGEYFRRDVKKWAGFMHGEQWYASGHGVAVRVGIRLHAWSY